MGLEPTAYSMARNRTTSCATTTYKWRFLILCRSYLQTPGTHLFEFAEMTNLIFYLPGVGHEKLVKLPPHIFSTSDRDRTCIFSSSYGYKIRSLARLLMYVSDHGGIRTHENWLDRPAPWTTRRHDQINSEKYITSIFWRNRIGTSYAI